MTSRAAEVLSTGRAWLTTRFREMRRAGMHGLNRLISRTRARLAPEPDEAFVDAARAAYRATAYEEAAREATWRAAMREADSLSVSAPAVRSPASAISAAVPVSAGSASGPDAVRMDESAPELGIEESPAGGWAPKPGPSAPDRAVADPAAERPPEPRAAEPPPRRARRKIGETAPDHLLHPAAHAGAKADDFFGGIKRRVEGDR